MQKTEKKKNEMKYHTIQIRTQSQAQCECISRQASVSPLWIALAMRPTCMSPSRLRECAVHAELKSKGKKRVHKKNIENRTFIIFN